MPEMHRLHQICTLFSPVKNGPKQGIFVALTHTEKNVAKNEILVM